MDSRNSGTFSKKDGGWSCAKFKNQSDFIHSLVFASKHQAPGRTTGHIVYTLDLDALELLVIHCPVSI